MLLVTPAVPAEGGCNPIGGAEGGGEFLHTSRFPGESRDPCCSRRDPSQGGTSPKTAEFRHLAELWIPAFAGKAGRRGSKSLCDLQDADWITASEAGTHEPELSRPLSPLSRASNPIGDQGEGRCVCARECPLGWRVPFGIWTRSAAGLLSAKLPRFQNAGADPDRALP